MAFDPKGYKTGVVVALAKDRARMDAVATAIRELKSGGGDGALAAVDVAMILAVDPSNPGDLSAHFASLEINLNKWGGNPPSASLIGQLLRAMKDAALDYQEASFWAGQAQAQAKARAGQIAEFVRGVKADHPLGVITPEEFDRATKGAGLVSFPAVELTKAAAASGLTVTPDFDIPDTAVPPVLMNVIAHPDFRTIADLLVFPGHARSVEFIDRLRIDGNAVTLADIASAHRHSETAKDSNAVQDAQKALGLLKTQCADDSQLHRVVAAALMKQAASITAQGGTRLQQRDGLVGRGLAEVDAARLVSKLNPGGGSGAAKPPSVQISGALAAGNIAEARRLASALTDSDGDRQDRAAAVARLNAAESDKRARLGEYEQAVAARDFGAAARALAAAIQIDAHDHSLTARRDALPPGAPGSPSLRAEGSQVVVAWPASAEPGVRYAVVRTEGVAVHTPRDGVPIGTITEVTSVTDDAPPIGRRARYCVFATRDGNRFSDAASEELLVLPAPSDLVATVDTSQVSLSWRMPSEALAAQIVQQAADGTESTFDVTAGRSLDIPGLTLGQRYSYAVRAVYATADGRSTSEPARIEAVPRGALTAVRDFAIAASMTDAGESVLEASWLAVDGYSVDVWEFPIGSAAPAGHRSTSAELAARGGRPLVARPGGDSSGGRETRRFESGGGVFSYAPVTVDDDGGVVGTSLVSGVAPSVTSPVAERFGEAVKLSWVWPDGDLVMEVSWMQGGSRRSARITRARYRADGGVTLQPAGEISQIAVATVVRTVDDEWVSAAVAVPFAGKRPAVTYSLAVKKGMFKGGVVQVSVDPLDYSGPLEVELVCATGAFMPTRASDGASVARERLTLTARQPHRFEHPLPKLSSPFWVRLFVADGSAVTLLDPPTTSMKG